MPVITKQFQNLTLPQLGLAACACPCCPAAGMRM